MATAYGPRRLNVVTVGLLVGLAGLGYWMWRFFPAYWDGWTVDHILKEGASAIYRANRLSEPARTTALNELADKARADIQKKAHVTDPDLEVKLDIDGDQAALSARYEVVITHPLITRTTTLHFFKKQTADIKAVVWDENK
jgi:hypothetical protein